MMDYTLADRTSWLGNGRRVNDREISEAKKAGIMFISIRHACPMVIHYYYDCLLLESAVDPDERRDDCLIVSNRHSNQETKTGIWGL